MFEVTVAKLLCFKSGMHDSLSGEVSSSDDDENHCQNCVLLAKHTNDPQ